MNVFYNIKEFYQRGKKGYSDTDKWNYFSWLSENSAKMLKEIEPNIVGCPQTDMSIDINKMPIKWVEENTRDIENEKNAGADGYDTDFLYWKLILRRIAYCFEIQDELFEDNPLYPELCNQYGTDWEYQLTRGGKKLSELMVPSEDKKTWEVDFGKVDPELEKAFEQRNEEIEQFKAERKDEALDLIKKYFYHLWD